jgi:hypothetical protein
MVFYSQQVLNDFDEIFEGLLTWDKINLSQTFITDYVNELKNQCEHIPFKSIHNKTTYSSHKKFGSKVHRYRRNSHTIWYIIYNMDNEQNIFINKIISNHATH